MKVMGELIGITQNPAARMRFLLIAPELSQLSNEAHEMFGHTSKSDRKLHHTLTGSKCKRQERNIQLIKKQLVSTTNPFTYYGTDLINIGSKAVMPSDIQEGICRSDEVGEKLHQKFLFERIYSNQVNLWSTLKKATLRTWKSARKSIKFKSGAEIQKLKDNRNLLARYVIVSHSRPEIDLQSDVKMYEFPAIPHALFDATGSMLQCRDKSKFMAILEKAATSQEQSPKQ